MTGGLPAARGLCSRSWARRPSCWSLGRRGCCPQPQVRDGVPWGGGWARGWTAAAWETSDPGGTEVLSGRPLVVRGRSAHIETDLGSKIKREKVMFKIFPHRLLGGALLAIPSALCLFPGLLPRGAGCGRALVSSLFPSEKSGSSTGLFNNKALATSCVLLFLQFSKQSLGPMWEGDKVCKHFSALRIRTI